MKYEQEVREALIGNTIHLIAKGGFEKATTKAITHDGAALPNVKMNEVYIYRLFGSKERLYAVAFSCLDKEIVYALHACLEAHHNLEANTRQMLYEVFSDVWHFLLNNEDHCRCYIRYYYSVYFRGESLNTHNQLFDEIIAEFSPLFKREADVKSIMHSVFTTMLDFAVRVYNGDLESSQTNAEHIYNVVYCMMASYFKGENSVKTNKTFFI